MLTSVIYNMHIEKFDKNGIHKVLRVFKVYKIQGVVTWFVTFYDDFLSDFYHVQKPLIQILRYQSRWKRTYCTPLSGVTDGDRKNHDVAVSWVNDGSDKLWIVQKQSEKLQKRLIDTYAQAPHCQI